MALNTFLNQRHKRSQRSLQQQPLHSILGSPPRDAVQTSPPRFRRKRLRQRQTLQPGHQLIRTWAIALTCCAGGLVGIAVGINPANGEPSAANDRTGTQITRDGNRFDIDGGQRSRDGSNLFHSFEKFGLDANQIANFLSNPEIRNILARVVGNDPSIIDGLIQVSGGDSNLYLLNPSGVVFGPNARLNIAGSFTATTATGIGFDEGWLNAAGDPDYSNLVGTPSLFAFQTANPGSIFNSGELQVADGQSITLLGGTVVNTGLVSAPGGEILIAAVPGESMVRLSQEGNVLSLEVEAIAPESADALGIVEWSTPIASLPELLTGGEGSHATDVQVNDDGTVTLNGSLISTQAGSVAISGRVDVTDESMGNNATGGTVAIAGPDIQVIDAAIDASGTAGGGEIYIGGNERGEGSFPTSDRTSIDMNSTLNANASDAGDGGRIIVWSDGATDFSGSVSARGGLTLGDGGFVEISGKENLVFLGTVDLSAANGQLGTLLLDPENIRIVAGEGGANDGELSDNEITVDEAPDATFTLSEATLENITGNIILEAANDIIIDPLSDNFLILTGSDRIIFTADADLNGTGDFSMDPSNTIVTTGRDIEVRGVNITLGNIDTQFFQFVEDEFPRPQASGDVLIEASGGTIAVGHISTQNTGFSFNRDSDNELAAGNVIISSQTIPGAANRQPAPGGAVQVLSIDAQSFLGQGGTVELVGDTVQITDITANSPFFNESESIVSDVSINTSGAIFQSELPTQISTNDGTITVRHAGGPNNEPFSVGNAAVNGSQGALLQGGQFQDVPEEIPVGRSFSVAAQGGEDIVPSPSGVRIQSVNSAPTIAGSTLITAQQNETATIPLSNYVPSDINQDNVTVTLDAISIPPGGRLTLNGEVINSRVARTVGATDTLVYSPPMGRSRNLDASFTLTANDGVSTGSLGVSIEISPVSNPRDNTPTDNTPRDNTPRDNTPRDNTPRDNTPRDNTPRDNNSRDNTPTELAEEPVLELPRQLDIDINGEEPADLGDAVIASLNIDTINRTEVLESEISSLDSVFSQSFVDYLGLSEEQDIVTADEAKDIARLIEEATGEKPAFIYINFVPEFLEILPGESNEYRETDQLEVVVISAEGMMFRQRVPEATRDKVMALANQFRQDITTPFRRDRHHGSAQQLYDWIIAPIQDELQAREITNISFLAEAGLRSLPFAALYDGESYLIEQYSVGLMPSLSLTNTQYVDIRDTEMLAMGVSESTQGQSPLPTVPVELSTLVFDVWRGNLFLNESATLNNLKDLREETPYGIIHMATHADFKAGPIEDSYIQLWEERLQMDEVRQLGWSDPPVEMLVLSACRTALGNEEAELGFAGLAVQTGVKSAVASLWYVSDTATAAIMTRFYSMLNEAPIKAEALRLAQIAMLRGDIRVENGLLFVPGLSDEGIELPEGSLTNVDLSHPYYWSGFTIVGNPW